MASLLVAAGVGAATASTAGTVMSVISTAATIAGGISSYQQGQAAQDQAEMQARAEEVNGRMQAIATNDELLKTLSRNNAVAAASGIQSSGSVARAQEAAQRQASIELSTNRFNTEMNKSALNQKAEVASNRGKAALAGSLFDAVGTGYSSYSKIKGTK